MQASKSTPAPTPFQPHGDLSSDVAAIVSLFKVVRYSGVLAGENPIDLATLRVLIACGECDGVRASELAIQIHLDLSTVSRHVAYLEKQELLERTPDPRDGRASVIKLTDKGRQAVLDVLANRAAAIEPVLSRWPAADRDTLFSLLNRLALELRDEAAQSKEAK